MRELYLMRHGTAEEHAAGGDPARALTPEGRRVVRTVGRGLARLGVRVDAIWHSPYLRARETAGLVADELGGPPLVENALFTPSGPASTAADELRAASGALLVASHLPFLPALADELLGGAASLQFRPASVAHLTLPGWGAAVLSGFWGPDVWGA